MISVVVSVILYVDEMKPNAQPVPVHPLASSTLVEDDGHVV
jgi:hypothetical protein